MIKCVADFRSEQRTFVGTQRPVRVVFVEVRRSRRIGRRIAQRGRGVPIVNRERDVPSGKRLDLQSRPECERGVGRLRHVCGKRGRVSESGIWKQSREIARGEVGVDVELSGTNRDKVAEETLIQPEFVKPEAVVAIDVAERAEVADEIFAATRPVRVERARVKFRAAPAGELFQIHIEAELKQPIVNRASAHAADWVSINFARVSRAKFHALFRKPRPPAAAQFASGGLSFSKSGNASGKSQDDRQWIIFHG